MGITLDKKKSFTEGALFSKIFLFVLPVMATNLLQVLYNAADMVIVGLSSESDAVGAVGTVGPFVSIVLNIAMGFSVGITVAVSQAIGAKDDRAVSNSVHTGLCMGFLFGLLGGIIGVIISTPVLSLMGNQGKLLDLATLYTKIYFCGMPFGIFTNCLMGIFRAKGDAKTPLIVLTISGALNVLLNLFFVLVVGLSVEGVAIATVLSQVFSSIVLFIKLSREDDVCRVYIKKLKIEWQTFKEIALIGIPAGLQGALFSLSNMLIQSSIISVNNSICSVESDFQPVVRGNSVAASLGDFVYNATNSVYTAIVTVVGQNYGAKDFKRVKKATFNCMEIVCILGIIVGFGIYFLRNPLLALYGINKGTSGSLEQIAYETADIRLKILMFTYFTCGLMEVGSGCLRGLGKSTLSTVISLTGSCVFRVIWLLTVFKAYFTLESIYISYPISWVLTLTAHFVCSAIVIKKEEKKYKEKQERHKLAQNME